MATPWVLGRAEWTDARIKRAVLWLCEQTKKALLKLDGDDFRDHGLHQLLRDHGPSQKIAHRVFKWMMDTIKYHPAGKDPRRVLCFSPHPDDDVCVVRELIERIQPAQVYVAGDLSDPHGTHRLCAQIIFRALQAIEADTDRRPEVLLYRGAWQEWAPHVIDIAVPLSPSDLKRKKSAIFRHESQKDTALFPGPDDPREF